MAQVLAVTSDLIFSSKITGTAGALGLTAVSVSTPDAVARALAGGDVRLVFVDMSLPQGSAAATLQCSARHESRPKTVAYYSHVQTEQRDAAQAAGADQIMPRSRFNQALPQLLKELLD